jgi:PI-3-kinase-related kinase SMG-1
MTSDSCDTLLTKIDSSWSTEALHQRTLEQLFKETILESYSNDFLDNFAGSCLEILNLDESSVWYNERISLAYFVYICRSQEIPNFNSIKFDTYRHKIKDLNHMQTIFKHRLNAELYNEIVFALVRLSRKQTNVNLATRLIMSQIGSTYFNKNQAQFQAEHANTFTEFVFQHQSYVNIFNLNKTLFTLSYEIESAKLLNSIHDDKLVSIEYLSSKILKYCECLMVADPNQMNIYSQQYLNQEIKLITLSSNTLNSKLARSLLNLCKWLLNDQIIREMNTQFSTVNYLRKAEKVKRILEKMSEYKYSSGLKINLNANDSDLLESNDERILGELIDFSTAICPDLAKTWYTLANWSYNWGKKSADKAHFNPMMENSCFFELIPAHICPEEREYISRLLLSSVNSISMPEIACEYNRSLANNQELFNSDEMKSMLNKGCKSISIESIEKIVDLWRLFKNRIYYYFQLACRSYFTYLKLSAESVEKSYAEENILATLRLLKLLIVYAIELKEDLQEGLAQTPTQPWKSIISQLFCRLNHPESYVRQSITDLLCRVARDFPHLIVYSAVVGSQDGPTKIETVNSSKDKHLFKAMSKSPADNKLDEKIDSDFVDENNSDEMFADIESEHENENENVDIDQAEEDQDEQDDEQEIVHEEQKVELKNMYKYVLDTLTEKNPKMIDEVKLFVHEMRRITLLREELWFGTMNQISSDLGKRIDQLSNEINKLKFNESCLSEKEKNDIIREKYEIILQPIVSILENVKEITTKLEAETPNEEQFQVEFADQIDKALNQLKDVDNAFKPQNGYAFFKQLHQIFQQRSQKQQSTSLSMDQISPKLASIKASTIPIPGNDGQFCTIHSVVNSVLILPTKTRPKKLFFIGSNGKRYPYLFKGLEDLHLDERIMQFLSIINAMFTKINKSESPVYHALNYSVTPLGPRSGLISWVEGTTPLFTLYKKWQQREAIYQAGKQPNQQPKILRPNELYYAKLNPLLKENNIKNFHENRTECPIRILRQVLDELIKETPKDLLAKELWCSSSTPGIWWKNVQVYSRSTAVMSIIGYVIGLGDRHLDNVLVNLHTGQIAHIDYNVCFEKGHNLRVPERVPFRMTQIIEHALGLTGVDGVFRLSCEQVMETLRRGSETLLTLLEAFVYDPLLDWTSNDAGLIASFYGGGAAKCTNNETSLKDKKEKRKNTEKALTKRLYEMRMVENKSLLEKNCSSLMKQLEKLDILDKSLCFLTEKRQELESAIHLREQIRSYLDESLIENTKGNKHAIYTLHQRFNEYTKYKQNYDEIKQLIVSEIDRIQHLLNQFINLFQVLKSLSQNNESNKILKFQNILSELSSNEPYVDLSFSDETFTLAYQNSKTFFQSIGQHENLNKCQNFLDEMQQVKLEIHSLTEESCNFLMKFIDQFRWLPQNFYLNCRQFKVLDCLRKLSDFKNVKQAYLVWKEVQKELDLMKETQEINSKVFIQKLTLLEEIKSSTEKKIVELNLRKSTLQLDSQRDLLSDENKLNYCDQLKLNLEIFETGLCEILADESIEHMVDNFNYAVIPFFIDNLEKWLMMQSAASNSKQSLHLMQSIDGDWFLEEMLSLISNCDNFNLLIQRVYKKFDWPVNKFFTRNLDLSASLLRLFLNLRQVVCIDNNLFENAIRISFDQKDEIVCVLNQFESMNLDEFFDLVFTEGYQIENFESVQKFFCIILNI